MLMYNVVFAPKTYLPFYMYYITTDKSTTNNKRKILGYLPTGIDTTYRRCRVSTITMMEHINILGKTKRYDVIQAALLTSPHHHVTNADSYNIQKTLTRCKVRDQ